MKISISNIAWKNEEEQEVSRIMQTMGLKGVEVVPTRIAHDPTLLEGNALQHYRKFWNDKGITIVALQALLFGKPGLTLFDSDMQLHKTLEHLKKMIDVGNVLGAKVLVFGSPKNRKTRGRPADEVRAIAIPFFRELGQYAARYGMKLCIEPNPPEYDSDFIVTAQEAMALVDAVGSQGFGLHIDTGALVLTGEGCARIVEYGDAIAHIHVSTPYLRPLTKADEAEQRRCAEALRSIRYSNWVSIEMKADGKQGDNIAIVRDSLELISAIYGTTA